MDRRPGIWELLVLPQYLQPEMVHIIVQLAEHSDVSAAICNNPYLIHLLQSMEQDKRYQITGKITLNQPFTCLELAGFSVGQTGRDPTRSKHVRQETA